MINEYYISIFFKIITIIYIIYIPNIDSKILIHLFNELSSQILLLVIIILIIYCDMTLGVLLSIAYLLSYYRSSHLGGEPGNQQTLPLSQQSV